MTSYFQNAAPYHSYPVSKDPETQGIPPRALNGGLFTGEPFAKNAPWGNVPVIPDVSYMTQFNLRSANPPPGAVFHYPGTVRPGNNEPDMPGIERNNIFNQQCVSDASIAQVNARIPCNCHKCNMAKYAYLS